MGGRAGGLVFLYGAESWSSCRDAVSSTDRAETNAEIPAARAGGRAWSLSCGCMPLLVAECERMEVWHQSCSPDIQPDGESAQLGGHIRDNPWCIPDLTVEITRQNQRAWACFRKLECYLYSQPSTGLKLKVGMLEVEVVETLL